jgi:hypothetical protein
MILDTTNRGDSVAILFIVGREITNSLESDAPLKDFVKRTTAIQRTLVVIDGFDEASDGISAEQLLHEALAGGARVLVSSRPLERHKSCMRNGNLFSSVSR